MFLTEFPNFQQATNFGTDFNREKSAGNQKSKFGDGIPGHHDFRLHVSCCPFFSRSTRKWAMWPCGHTKRYLSPKKQIQKIMQQPKILSKFLGRFWQKTTLFRWKLPFQTFREGFFPSSASAHTRIQVKCHEV